MARRTSLRRARDSRACRRRWILIRGWRAGTSSSLESARAPAPLKYRGVRARSPAARCREDGRDRLGDLFEFLREGGVRFLRWGIVRALLFPRGGGIHHPGRHAARVLRASKPKSGPPPGGRPPE